MESAEKLQSDADRISDQDEPSKTYATNFARLANQCVIIYKENETLQNTLTAAEEEVRRLREALEEIENCDEITYISTVVKMAGIAREALKDTKP